MDCCTAGDLEDAQQPRRGEPSRTHPPWRRDGSLPGVSRRLPTPGGARAPADDSLKRVGTPVRPCRSRPRAASRWLAADCCTAATIGSTFTGLPTGPAVPTRPVPTHPVPAHSRSGGAAVVGSPVVGSPVVGSPSVVLTLRDPGGAGQYRRRGIWSRATISGARRSAGAYSASGELAGVGVSARAPSSHPGRDSPRLTATDPCRVSSATQKPCKAPLTTV